MAKILIVDDEEWICAFYKEELSEEGHTVVTHASGDRLLSKIDELRPDVVILDIKLVDYNGLELLQQIRNRYYDLPVVLCTAYDTYREDYRAMPADYYVVKSVDLSELKRAIHRAIEANQSMRLPEHW
jgi:two-component system response regulator (stage 0 sporulation protein F)